MRDWRGRVQHGQGGARGAGDQAGLSARRRSLRMKELPDFLPLTFMHDGMATGVEALRGAGGKSQPDVVLLIKTFDGDMRSEVVGFVDRHGLPRAAADFVEKFEQGFDVEMKPGGSARTIARSADDFRLRREQGYLPDTINQLVMTSQRGQDVDGMNRTGDTVTQDRQPVWWGYHDEENPAKSPASIIQSRTRGACLAPRPTRHRLSCVRVGPLTQFEREQADRLLDGEPIKQSRCREIGHVGFLQLRENT